MPSRTLMWSRSRSPLRYPGSKARFAKFIAQSLHLNGRKDVSLIEPFCGGASVSIALMECGLAAEIALNDADPGVAAFWDIVFNKDGAKWLAGQVERVPLTLTEWDRQKHLVACTVREAALRCLFINRTSFNGILHHRSGPIGGRTQDKRTLDCRFNRQKLAARILELSEYRDRVIAVECDPWRTFCSRYWRRKNAVFYIDPPFYHKAQNLYEYWFEEADHRVLRDKLRNISASWMLSYDDAPEVRALYADLDLQTRVIDSTYSTHPIGGGSFIGRELFFTNLPRLPNGKDGVDHEGFSVLVRPGSSAQDRSEGPVRRPMSPEALRRAA